MNIANIKDKILSIYKKPSFNYIIIALVIILLVILAYYYWYLPQPVLKQEKQEGFDTGKDAELLYFTVKWCPFCQKSLPIIQQLKTEMDGKMINGYKVIITEIDCTEETPEVTKMMNNYKIEGYPTLKLLKDGQVIEFDAKPTYENLTQFLNTVL